MNNASLCSINLKGYVNNASNPHTVGEACDHKSGGANGESVDAPAKDVTRVRTRE